MVYLDSFKLPIEDEEKYITERMVHNGGIHLGYIDNIYPCGIFSNNDFREVSFAPVTIFYGGNGSGKSTLLNLIADKLNLNRITPHNPSELFATYVDGCLFKTGYNDDGFKAKIPNGSRIITSDDIFDYMLVARTQNDEILEQTDDAKDDWAALKYGQNIRFTGMQDYENFRLQVMARRKSVSRRQFVKNTLGEEVKLNSNGETALRYFKENLQNDKLYCLDEPENSLSPKLQLELVKLLETISHYCGCQLIIATHSPFILALDGARIYNLDETPVDICNWWELENTKTYFEFFDKNRHLFE